MPSKEKYCYRILKTYSLIVNFEGIPQRENVPKPIDGETFKQWKERVLGLTISDVVLYVPTTPDPRKKSALFKTKLAQSTLKKYSTQ